MDYTKLPDGAILMTRDGRKWVKGPHPHASHVRTDAQSPVVGWIQHPTKPTDVKTWNTWAADGECFSSCGAHHENLDIVGFERVQDWAEQEIESMRGYGAIEHFVERVTALVMQANATVEATTIPQLKVGVKPAISGLTTQADRTHKFGGYGA